MSSLLQVRNVPSDVHRQLKSRASLAGMSLSEFVLAELKRSLERPTRSELVERLAAKPRKRLRTSVAALIRQERDER